MKGVGHVFLVLIITDVLHFLGDALLARIDSIQRGTWCPHCVRESARLGIEYAKKLARSKDGECLSKAYTNHKTYLHWKCSKSHEWLTSLSGIKY